MVEDLGSLGPFRGPHQFGKPAPWPAEEHPGWFVTMPKSLKYSVLLPTAQEMAQGWDANGSPVDDA